MKNLKNKIYPQIGHYLKDSVQPYIFTSELDKEVIEYKYPETFKVQGNRVIIRPGYIYVFHPNTTYDNIKSSLIRDYYSYDDQIALLLNKDRSDIDKELYEIMMEWRHYLAEVAKKIYNIKLNKYPE